MPKRLLASLAPAAIALALAGCGSSSDCLAGSTKCGPVCVDLKTDNANCGTCGNACVSGEMCSAGTCAVSCQVSLTDCGGTCRDLQTDADNCGACGVACPLGQVCAAGACGLPSGSVETFDQSTAWPWAPWALSAGTDYGTASPACAHDGPNGFGDGTGGDFYYRTDVMIGEPGQKLSAWVQPGTGRLYLGFGVTATGGYSLVVAPNTSQLVLQDNAGWTYTDVASASYTYTAGSWYRVEVDFAAGGVVTGLLFGSDGVTQLATVSATLSGLGPGGVAFRSFGGFCLDTVAVR